MLLVTVLVVVLLLAALGPLLAKRGRIGDEIAIQPPGGPIVLVDPRELLFSIPTLNDGVPPVDSDTDIAGESAAALLPEDDWRQKEFTAVANRDFVREMLARLNSHRAVHAQGIGFRDVLVREEPPTRLTTLGVRLAEVRAAVGAPSIPLYLNSTRRSRVRGGFAVTLDDVGYVYGLEVDGFVAALGLGLVGTGLGDVASIAELTKSHGLLFVDWIRGVVIEPGDANGFRRWLGRIIHADPG